MVIHVDMFGASYEMKNVGLEGDLLIYWRLVEIYGSHLLKLLNFHNKTLHAKPCEATNYSVSQ